MPASTPSQLKIDNIAILIIQVVTLSRCWVFVLIYAPNPIYEYVFSFGNASRYKVCLILKSPSVMLIQVFIYLISYSHVDAHLCECWIIIKCWFSQMYDGWWISLCVLLFLGLQCTDYSEWLLYHCKLTTVVFFKNSIWFDLLDLTWLDKWCFLWWDICKTALLNCCSFQTWLEMLAGSVCMCNTTIQRKILHGLASSRLFMTDGIFGSIRGVLDNNAYPCIM